MPNVQEIIVDLQLDTSDLDSAADKLEALGVIDKAAAAQFRAANVEIKNKEAALKSVAATAIKSGADSKKTIDDLDKAVKNLTSDFVTGFSEGVSDALTEAGVSAEEFSEAMKKAGGEASTAKEQAILLADKLAALKSRLKGVQDDKSFTGLQKQVSDARQRVLETATTLERLRKTGGVGTEKFKELSEQLKKNQGELRSLEQEFQAVQKAANVDIKPVLEEASAATASLKTRLNEVTKQLQVLKLEGKDNTAQYKALTKEAGNLRDAIGDVSTEINNAAANSQALDGLIGVAQGVTGAFAVAQGTVALFGTESEELQEVLLRVNAAMAIMQGLQQVTTVLQGESAAATFLQTVGQRIYNVVIGQSIGLMAAFRVALAATGIGLLILGVTALVAALKSQSKATEDAIKALEKLNFELERDTKNLDEYVDSVKRNGEEQIAALENAGATDAQLRKERIKNSQEELKSIFEVEAQYRAQTEAARSLLQQVALGSKEFNQQQVDEAEKLIGAFETLKNRRVAIASEIRVATIENEKQTREEVLKAAVDTAQARLSNTVKNSKAELAASKDLARAKANAEVDAAGQNASEILRIQAELNDQLRDLDRAFNQSRQQDRIAGIEAALIAEQQISQAINSRQSQAEIDLQKRLVQEKANLELLQEGLTANQIKEIKARAQADILKLQRDFNKQSAEETLQDFISANNAQLAAVEITNKEKLNLTIDNIIAQAQIEVEQNKGLSEKIKEINAKRDADIRAARLQSIQQTVNDEIALRTATSGVDTRADEKILAAQDEIRAAGTEREKRAIEERLNVRRLAIGDELALIDQIAARETANIDSRLGALNDSFAQGLISYRDYNLQYQQLTDQQAQVTEDAEQKKRNALAKTEAEAKQRQQRIISFSIQAAQQTLSILEEIFQQQADREQARIDEQRERVSALREAGAITEKQERERQKKLDQEERKLKIQQARRNKVLAVFNAIISTAQAVATALTAGPIIGPILAAITAALGAAQIALIISKPIPQFKTGKKNAYQGPGVVGEAGAELIERDGQMFIAPKKTIVWLGAKDKVFNPKETIAMLEKPGLQTSKVVQMDQAVVHGERLDYDKLGKVIARNTQGVSLNIDGYRDFVIQGHAFDTYLNNRRAYK